MKIPGRKQGKPGSSPPIPGRKTGKPGSSELIPGRKLVKPGKGVEKPGRTAAKRLCKRKEVARKFAYPALISLNLYQLNHLL